MYLIVGGMAAKVGFGMGGRPTDTQGALVTILRQPFGTILLAAVAAGLFGYAVWLLLSAALDGEGRGSHFAGIVARLGVACRGIVHAALGGQAALIILGWRGKGASAREWTARLLAAPLGGWLVGIAGAAVLGYGIYQLYRVFTADLTRDLALGAMSRAAAKWAVRLGGFGVAARGLVFAVIGFFLIRAAHRYDAGEAKGIAEALRTMASRSSPPWLLGAVAVGLVSYGLYELFEARYRRIRAA